MSEEVPEARFYKNRIIVPDEPQANKIHQKGSVGKPLSGGRLQLAPVEALYLLDEGNLSVVEGGTREELSFEELSSALSEEDPDILLKYRVYKDLRSRGLVVKTGLKYGAHFRVYDRGETPGSDHSPYLVHAVSENVEFSPTEVARAVRLAHGVRKRMIFAVVDNEGDVTYYSVKREKL